MDVCTRGIDDSTGEPKRCCLETGVCCCVFGPIALAFLILAVAYELDMRGLIVLLLIPMYCLIVVFSAKCAPLMPDEERRVYMPLPDDDVVHSDL